MSYSITRSVIRSLAPFAALLVTVAGCAPSGSRAAASPTRDAARDLASSSSSERYSIYDLDARWHDQRGTAMQLASLRGRPQLLAMIYTHCSTTCPFTVAEMKRIERESPANVGFVLVSLDPARDDPARLAVFAKERGLDPSRWTLLDGSDDAVRELATVIGVRYRRISPTELAHSNALTLLDADGVVVDQHAGLDAADEIIDALSRGGR